ALLRLTASERRIFRAWPDLVRCRPCTMHRPSSKRSVAACAKITTRAEIAHPDGFPLAPNPGCKLPLAEGGHAMSFPAPTLLATPQPTAELDRLGDEIAELSAHLAAPPARVAAPIPESDARGGWNTGFRSCAEWLGWRVGLDKGAAREWVRVARALGTLPRLTEALSRGDLSYSKVRALTRVATPETEARLLAVGRAGTAEHVERGVQGWRQVDRRAEARKAARQHEGRGLQVYEDEDGMMVVRGRLTPEAGALLRRALEAGREVLYEKALR